jgi:hypothetical protein
VNPLRAAGGALLGTARTVASATFVRALAVETAWTATHLALDPLGIAREQV